MWNSTVSVSDHCLFIYFMSTTWDQCEWVSLEVWVDMFFQFNTWDICICRNTLQRLIHDLASALEETEQVDEVLLDFRKAFDEVSNQRFSIKLDHYGILGDILQWIQSCITNISQQVLVEGHTSTPAPVTSGVPQGTALGALLFLIFINGLPLKNSSTTHLFADDSLLNRRIKSPKDAQKLQEDIV